MLQALPLTAVEVPLVCEEHDVGQEKMLEPVRLGSFGLH